MVTGVDALPNPWNALCAFRLPALSCSLFMLPAQSRSLFMLPARYCCLRLQWTVMCTPSAATRTGSWA